MGSSPSSYSWNGVKLREFLPRIPKIKGVSVSNGNSPAESYPICDRDIFARIAEQHSLRAGAWPNRYGTVKIILILILDVFVLGPGPPLRGMSGFPAPQQAQARNATLASARLPNGKIGMNLSELLTWKTSIKTHEWMLMLGGLQSRWRSQLELQPPRGRNFYSTNHPATLDGNYG